MLSANNITVVLANQLTLGNGASIVTGGDIRPAGTIPAASLVPATGAPGPSVLVPPGSLLPANNGPGAYFVATNFTQSGQSSLSGLGGGPATLQINVTGNVKFDPRSGLAANNGWLILNLTTGTATGNVSVKSLDVRTRRWRPPAPSPRWAAPT